MAAIALIAGSVLGWIAAATALFTGSVASTAFIVFLLISLVGAASTMVLALRRTSS